ncbi:MAG: hypothetical protein ACRCSU_11565 [Paracoccaceae bacterium]
MTRVAGSLLALAAFVASPALAEDVISKVELPTIVDFNGDGMWSMAELQTIWVDLKADAFIQTDTNLDGAVDRTELSNALSKGVLQPVES